VNVHVLHQIINEGNVAPYDASDSEAQVVLCCLGHQKWSSFFKVLSSFSFWSTGLFSRVKPTKWNVSCRPANSVGAVKRTQDTDADKGKSSNGLTDPLLRDSCAIYAGSLDATTQFSTS